MSLGQLDVLHHLLKVNLVLVGCRGVTKVPGYSNVGKEVTAGLLHSRDDRSLSLVTRNEKQVQDNEVESRSFEIKAVIRIAGSIPAIPFLLEY